MTKQRISLLVGALAVVIVAALQAADVTGKWVAQVPGRDGQTVEQTFTFKVDGEKLTGSVSGPRGDVPITDGKISGDDLAFTLVVQDNTVKLLYKGKVAGDEIKFTRQREGRDQTQEFVAKRATS